MTPYPKLKFVAIECHVGTPAPVAIQIAVDIARIFSVPCGQNFNGKIFSVTGSEDPAAELKKHFPDYPAP